ncbi:unnamed protein product, partial [Larinioides sclopetarius]
ATSGKQFSLSDKGCFFHGCPTCFDGHSIHPLLGVTMYSFLEKTKSTTAKLRNKGYHVIEEWEHSFQTGLKQNPELKQFVSDHEVRDIINPRDPFYGGRTNAVKLYYEGTAKY